MSFEEFKNSSSVLYRDLDDNLCALESRLDKIAEKKPINMKRFKGLLEKPISWREIGDHFNITKDEAIKFAKKNGLSKKYNLKKKSDDVNIDKLKALLQEPLTWEEISKKLKTPTHILCRLSKKLKLTKKTLQGHHRKKNIDLVKLKEFLDQNYSYMKIGSLLGCSATHIRNLSIQQGFR